MTFYRFFLIRDGEPVGQVKRHLADDLDALDVARALSRDHVVEVYQDIRLVARVKEGDESLNVGDARSVRPVAKSAVQLQRILEDARSLVNDGEQVLADQIARVASLPDGDVRDDAGNARNLLSDALTDFKRDLAALDLMVATIVTIDGRD